MQDGRGGNRVLESRQGALIELVQSYTALVESSDGIDEFLETNISVSGLAAEITFLVGCISHIETKIWFGGVSFFELEVFGTDIFISHFG